ncbi:MAG: hypothetical protein JW746_06715 [Candidatus Krumholzibacteriota bacterium]|nr:hypothetical protein [Candidatus Krumholzibacteriota bacterium]
MRKIIEKENFESGEFYKKAQARIQRGAFDEAAMLINEALKMHPDDPYFLSMLGFCTGMRGNLFAGEKMCRQALEMAKDKDPVFYVNIGRLLLSGGNRVEARKYFMKAYRIDNTNSPAALELSRMGVRKRPIVRFLERDHPLNIWLGRIRHSLSEKRAGYLNKKF